MARRMTVPDGAVRQTEVRDPSGLIRRYDSSSGYVTVSDADARSLRANGFHDAVPGGAQPTGKGRRCTSCGFGSHFVACSRCGGRCEKEQ